jgi:hypothetical protein
LAAPFSPNTAGSRKPEATTPPAVQKIKKARIRVKKRLTVIGWFFGMLFILKPATY